MATSDSISKLVTSQYLISLSNLIRILLILASIAIRFNFEMLKTVLAAHLWKKMVNALPCFRVPENSASSSIA